ncbi:MAG: gamma-glutamyltransferase [Silanimonas sp.]|jgi:gamma-glutamyltranspeptidase/glutathione hydrolase|nr:gamma-glutamyltransferase [Silanimonas sp.]
MRPPTVRSVLIAALMAALPLAGFAADRITGPAFTTRSEVHAPRAMAATSHPLATQVALDVMRRGGTAVDAAIAANAAIGLMEPTGNGIGGDLFAIVWDPKTRKLHGYNGSGRSPRGLAGEWFDQQKIRTIPAFGALPVTVPGAVDGWFALHGRFGRMPMAEVLQPAIDYARHGHPVAETIAYYWERSVPRYRQYPGFTEQFTIDGRAPRTGETWTNENLARTYERIARDGRAGFYEGELPKIVEAYFKENGGFLSAADFAAHRGEWVEPVGVNYRGVDVWELPPSGQGIAALQMLQILEGYDFSKIPFGSTEHLHLLTEAKKLAFADRARYYADPSFVATPVAGLISDAYADAQRQRIDPNRAQTVVAPGTPPSLDEGDTIYLTTADASGMMVSLIQSNYRGMGSGMTPPGLGFMLQNRGEQFSLKPGHPNEYAPGKRPFHTIIPAFITKDGQPWVSFGLMGGAMQPQGHVQIVMNLVDFGMNLQEAGDAPRLHHDGSDEPVGAVTPMNDGGVVQLETGFDYATIRGLMRKGHTVEFADGPYGGYQAIAKSPHGGWVGASESRKDGQAAGY